MSGDIECKNNLCKKTFKKVKKGGYWKKFCSSKCRSQYHSTYGVIKNDNLRITANTRLIYPAEMVAELNQRVAKVNLGISTTADLLMISSIIEYMKLQLKDQSRGA